MVMFAVLHWESTGIPSCAYFPHSDGPFRTEVPRPEPSHLDSENFDQLGTRLKKRGSAQ